MTAVTTATAKGKRATANVADLDIQAVPFKRNEYDRGARKIIVNGIEWGYYAPEFHGCHGPSYHAHDFHGPIMVPYENNRAKKHGDSFRGQSERQHFRSQIGKPDHEKTKHKPILEQLADHARTLIRNGHLRHPDIRLQEIEAQRERHRLASEAIDRQEREKFHDKARTTLQAMPGYSCGPESPLYAQDIDLLVDMMKWAQTQ